MWVVFSNGNKAQVDTGKDVTLSSAEACSLLPVAPGIGLPSDNHW